MWNEPKTLLILTPGFPENEADSVCLPAQQALVMSLKNNFPNLKVIILSFEYPFTREAYLWHGVQVIPFNSHKKGKLFKLIVWLRIWKKLNKLKSQEQIIGLFSFWCTECALLGKYFAKWHKLKHFIWILGQDARKENRFIKWIQPKSEELVAMSDYLSREFYQNHSIKPLHVIPNAINPLLYSLTPTERVIDVLGVGSLIPLKQYDIFIRVIKELAKELPTLQSMICGDGPEKNRLRKFIGKLHVESHISLVGEKDHPEILKLMQSTRLFLHPSSYEGFSSVCLEALYAGAHVISFINPMHAWINHWHIVKSQEEMIEKALEILRNPELDHKPVLPYPMHKTAQEIIHLYN